MSSTFSVLAWCAFSLPALLAARRVRSSSVVSPTSISLSLSTLGLRELLKGTACS